MSKITYEQRIPKNIFQTWGSKRIPPTMKTAMKTLQNLNPEYRWTFYDDNDCRKLIAENFNPFVLMAYDSLVPGAFKADLWRLCVLYMYGGVYADCKQVHLLPLREYIKPDCDFFICNDLVESGGGLYNAIIGSTAKSEILMHLINKIVWNVANHYYGDSFLAVTGPIHCSSVINSLMERDVSSSFDLTRYKVIGYNVDIPLQLVHGLTLHTIDASGRRAFLRAYPSYYRLKHNTAGKDTYSTLWLEGKIYANQLFSISQENSQTIYPHLLQQTKNPL